MTPILLGALVALAAVAWVLAPLFARAGTRAIAAPAPVAPETTQEIRCATCGLRPEPDARYCSSCGAPLATRR